jgi:hypothetical protein
MSELYKSNDNSESKEIVFENKEQFIEERQPTIEELLPRYYEGYGEMEIGRYETLRSMPVDGHDIAWMAYTYDVVGQGGEIEHFCTNTFTCACKFTEGVGWAIGEDGRPHGFYRPDDDCLPKQAAIYLRQQELRREYVDRFKDEDPFISQSSGIRQKEHIKEVILDLMEKDKAGEFIGESSNGAHFWGGHFYIQLVMEITGADPQTIWPVIHKMKKNKQIDLEGFVIQTYDKPPEPTWDEYNKLEMDGLTVTAFTPGHSKMPQIWRYMVVDGEGKTLIAGIAGSALTHESAFGIDVDDVATARAEMIELAQLVKDKLNEGFTSLE